MKELRRFRYFKVAAENGSFRRAAKVLGLQESTISRAIRDLEDELGASLFHRHVGGVSLTVAGESFLQRTRIVLQQVDDVARDISAVGRCERGRINVGILSSLASGFLVELLTAFGRDHAGVRIDLSDGHPRDHVAAIRQLGLDVTFVTGTRDWEDCETEKLWSEKVFVVLPQGHEMAHTSVVEWSDLEAETFIVSDEAPGPDIRDYLTRRLADLGHYPCVQPCKLGRHNLLSLVALGHGLTVTTEATTASSVPGIVYRPIASEVLPFSAVWSPRNANPALRRLLSMARQMSNAVVS